MLYEFLINNRTEILAHAEKRTLKLAGVLPSSVELRKGLPLFYEHLIEFLNRTSTKHPEESIASGAAFHGRELLRLNYTLSHVVHAYGALCQAITDFAQTKNIQISPREFNDLNLALDIAIAAAVSEFEFHSVHASQEREVQHMGFLVHELRNSLSSATIAQDMIRQGLVGTSGSTARVLEQNLARMRDLIDRSLSDVRLKADPIVHVEKFILNSLVDQILLTARSEAKVKSQTLINELVEIIELETDRQLLLSAIANILQNALKYSERDTNITVRAKESGMNVIIEVHDEGQGISKDKIENLFKPFTSGGFDQSGMGLGLTIVQRAMMLMQGKVSVVNGEKCGCSFILEIPKKLVPNISRPQVFSGIDSIQPSTKRKK
jgi:signal transduction histidine kinase